MGVFGDIGPSREEIEKYRERVDEFVNGSFKSHLQELRKYRALVNRSREIVFALTNERAGAPVEGLIAQVHFPDKDQFEIMEAEDFPDEPDAPSSPTPPQPASRSSFLDTLVSPQFVSAPLPLINQDMGGLAPPGNVSGPRFKKGSVIVEYEVDEVLHNLMETTSDSSLVAVFHQPGVWRIPYEIHARNLPEPRKGVLVIEVREAGKPGANTTEQ